MTLAEFWPQCLRLLHAELSEQQFKLAIAPLTVGMENGAWVVYAKNQFAANLLRAQYADKIESARQKIAPDAPPLHIKIGTGEHHAAAPAAPNHTPQHTVATTVLPETPVQTPNNTPDTPPSADAPPHAANSANTSAKNKKTPAKPRLCPIRSGQLFPDIPLPDAPLPTARAMRSSAAEKPAKTPPLPAAAPPAREYNAREIIARRLNNLRGGNSAPPKSPAPPAKDHKPAKPKHEQPDPRQKATNLSGEYTFDSLVEGKGNHLAVAIAKNIAEKPGDSMYNPFFIYGSTGLGKTHLTQATGNALLRHLPTARARYVHANEYLKNFMAHARNKTWDNFKQQYLQYDLLILDDIQFLQGKERTMEEFFILFEHYRDNGRQIILTCDQHPNSLTHMAKRLVSRFSWGMTLKLEPPELEMRVNILARKAQSAGVALAEDAALFIAQNIKQNVRELEGALNRVLARCRFEQRKRIDIDLASDALQDIISVTHTPVTAEKIMKTVADFHQIRVSDLLGKKRSRNIARPRQLAMAITKELTNMSLPAIGEVFGGRDHTTVMHALKTIDKLLDEDQSLRQDYDKLLILAQH
ncbi:chromosomal replication initiator protein DnaA [Conchiformibius kuhniae]|uniref:Chromosomal replication initiator protein DnaA n=1 Tax=Conchiformibius kuhniae TaxID=211502 RepID=A0ABD8B787_9NEIS|nr:chromosomal replication initiator protein DnaA [Conchiformibius kuhniae]